MNPVPPAIDLGATARTPEEVRSLHRLGLSFAEIPVTEPHLFEGRVEQYRQLREELGLYYLCHGPREGDPNDRVSLRERYLPSLMAILPMMTELEMHLLTIHLWLDPRFVREEVIRFKIALLKELTEKATNAGITICLENLSEQVPHLEAAFGEIPLLFLTLDLGHAQLLTEVNTGYDFMETHPARIRHVHVHDNRGGNSPTEDLHLPPGEGVIEFESLLRKLLEIGYHRTVTLELKPHQIAGCLGRVRRLLHLPENVES